MSQDNPNWAIHWTENDSDITWHVEGTFRAVADTINTQISFSCESRKQAERLCGALHGMELTFVNVEASGHKHINTAERECEYYRGRLLEEATKLRDAMNGLLADLSQAPAAPERSNP